MDDKHNEFKDSCPKHLTKLPKEPCDLGQKSLQKPLNKNPICPWWINSETHNFCFWKYVNSESNIDGVMKIHTIDEIHKLLKIPKELIDQILEKSITCIKESDLQSKNIDSMEDEQITDLINYDDVFREMPSDDIE